MMRVDMRVYPGTRDAVHAGMAALRVQGRQIWGDTRHTLPDIVNWLTVGSETWRGSRETVQRPPPGGN